jgi:predicted Zn-dependent protease
LPGTAFAAVLGAAITCVAVGATLAHGIYEERLARASEQIAASPKDPEPLIRRQVLRREHGDFAGALSDLEAAAVLSPGRPGLDALRGRLALESGHPERAVVPLERALLEHPEDPESRLSLARALLAVGRPLDAAGHYSLAIEQAPVKLPAHYLERARALRAAGPEYRDRALEGLDEGMTRLGTLVSLANLAIILEVERGRFDAALARLDALAAASPRKESFRGRRAEILEQAGRSGEARAEWTRALAEIEDLSLHQRQTTAMTQLATRARGAIDRLESDSEASASEESRSEELPSEELE